MTADGYPVAYCAPGQRLGTAIALVLKGEQVARIEEHPWLKGNAGFVVSEPPNLNLNIDPETFRIAG